MKTLILFTLLAAGCATPERDPTVDDVSSALGREIVVQYADADGQEMRNSDTLYVYLRQGWLLAPYYYRMGAIVALAANAADRDPFYVLDTIGIPRRFAYTKP